MRPKSMPATSPSERLVKDIRRARRKHYSAAEKIRIVLDGLRGDASIAELCRREGIAEGLYYSWSKEFLEAGKRRLAGDTARAATSSEVTSHRQHRIVLADIRVKKNRITTVVDDCVSLGRNQRNSLATRLPTLPDQSYSFRNEVPPELPPALRTKL